jgi:two-component system sensor histidine kinase FlrB
LLLVQRMHATKLAVIEDRRSELQAAFLTFGSVSEQLSGAFESLQAEVARLRSELGVARADKEQLAARHAALIDGLPVLQAQQQRLLTLGELAAGLAHQIRTPLATALLYASQMALPGRDMKDLGRCSEKTVASLKQLDRLVTDMLALAHGGAAREVVSVSALLEQVAQWLKPALRAGVRLTIRTEAPELTVRANAASLVSAVLNLATNALQAATGDLDLELLGRRVGADRAQIIVSDNGPGVPEEFRERIFEPFFTTRARGNGIGLAIVKSIIEAHAGCVQLAESACGATFVIDLPAEQSA